MGNTTTKEKADHIDGGALLPHGVYSGPQDYDFRIVQRLILQRKLAPFYKGLDDWDDSEDAQEEKEKQQQQQLNRASNTTTTPILNTNTATATTTAGTAPHHHPHHHQQHRMSEAEREMRRLYQGAIECPICFLYYPRNINRTRCCDKPMCTECFVQIKRLESAPTESPACPYCVEPNFGVIYSLALLPSGLLSSPPASSSSSAGQTTVGGTSMSNSSSSNSIERTPEIQSPSSPSVRRRSTSHKSSEVVTADELRPDWNRRILAAAQRQPGSRRASTSSTMNATFALGRRLAVGRQGTTSRRSNSSAAAADYNGYLTVMRNMGTDLEELMIMEAMRQSLQDEHDRLAREAAAASATNAGAASGNAAGNANALSPGLGSRSGGTERAQTTITRSPLSSPLAPPSTSFSTPTTAQGGPRGTRARRDGDGHDDSSSSSRSENESGSESDQDRPELLHNRAIRFAAVPIPRPTAVETTGGPKHRPQEEATNSPETV